jgi:hypothetical protein
LPCSPLHIVRTKGSVTSLCVVKKFRKKSFGEMAWCRLPWRAHQERCDLSPGWVGRNRRPLLGSLHRYGDITSPLVEMFRTGGPVNKSRRSPRVVRRAVAESPGLVRDAESMDPGQSVVISRCLSGPPHRGAVVVPTLRIPSRRCGRRSDAAPRAGVAAGRGQGGPVDHCRTARAKRRPGQRGRDESCCCHRPSVTIGWLPTGFAGCRGCRAASIPRAARRVDPTSICDACNRANVELNDA